MPTSQNDIFGNSSKSRLQYEYQGTKCHMEQKNQVIMGLESKVQGVDIL